MAKRYLLDTNIVIAGIRGERQVLDRLDEIDPGQLLLSAIVVGELLTWVEKSDQPRRSAQALKEVVSFMGIESVDQAVAQQYAALRAHLESRGHVIGVNDTWIAAHGLTLGAIVVTANEREFSRVPGLAIENWIH